MGLECNDLGVLRQRGVSMKLLLRLIRLHVDIDAVAQTQGRTAEERFVALGKELEAEFKMRLRFPSIRGNVTGGTRYRRIWGQEPAGLGGECFWVWYIFVIWSFLDVFLGATYHLMFRRGSCNGLRL